MPLVETVDDIPTPAFVVDLDKVERNCRRMLDKARLSGVTLRPHVKTHKTVEGTRLQLGAETGPITVSTLAEAEFFADAGFRDITYAVPLGPDKLDRISRLQRKIDVLHVLVDHPDAVTAADTFAAERGISFSVFVKVDCGYHRAGVDPASPLAVDLVRSIDRSPRLRYAGALTHAGHSYHADDPEQIAEIAATERSAVVDFARRLEQAGISGGITSIGSTPTMAVARDFEGIDEIRPGNYIFFDAFQATIGSCDWSDCAATVIASIISIQPALGQVIIDAGALALSKDLGASHLREPSYGVIVLDGRIRDDMRLYSLSQEHGQIEVRGEKVLSELRIGQKLRIIVNHSCLTAAMYQSYHVVRGERLVGTWQPVSGW